MKRNTHIWASVWMQLKRQQTDVAIAVTATREQKLISIPSPHCPYFNPFFSFLHTCPMVLSEHPCLKISQVPLLWKWKEMCCAGAGECCQWMEVILH